MILIKMPIPKVIYQTWKTKNLHDNCIKVRDQIQKLNPDYEMILYDDHEMDQFIQSHFDPFIYKCYLTLHVGASKADFWRYCILYKKGGVYLDIDSDLLLPLNELIQEDDQCIITREGNDGCFNNWIMIFEKDHPILLKTIMNCCYNISNRTTHDVCLLTGPHGPFTNAINETMIPFYTKNTNLYFERDDEVNSVLNNPNNPIRSRFYGVDMGAFAKWKHNYCNDLYNGSIYWKHETKIFNEFTIMDNLELLKVYSFDDKIRYGNNHDGGYVFGHLEGEYDCYISCGISIEESFSRDFINRYNMNEYNCFGFDGTVNSYPYDYTNKISFIKKNIASFNDDHNTNLSFLMNKYDSIFLKMDIEGGEYPWLLSLNETQLKKFKQIVIEFHGITDDGWGCYLYNKIKCLEKLSNTHYIIHAHGNNHGPVLNGIPDVIELTYVNKNYFSDVPPLNTQSFPIDHLDFPNKPGFNDISLHFYPFVQK